MATRKKTKARTSTTPKQETRETLIDKAIEHDEREGFHLSADQLSQVQGAISEINQMAAAVVHLSRITLEDDGGDAAEVAANAISAAGKQCSMKADLVARVLGDRGIGFFNSEFEPVAREAKHA